MAKSSAAASDNTATAPAPSVAASQEANIPSMEDVGDAAIDGASNTDFGTAPIVEENVSAKPLDLSTPAPKEEEAKPDYSWVPDKFKNKETGEPDFEKLAKSYSNLEKKLGTSGDVPDAPEEYDYTFTAFEADEKAQNDFKKAAHDMGFTKSQYDFVMSVYEKMVEDGIAAPERTVETLQKQWGKEYETNLHFANVALETYMPNKEPISKYPHLANDPIFAQIMANIGRELQEDVGVRAEKPSQSAQSKLEIQELMNAPDYWTNKEKQRIVSEWYSRGNRI